MTKSILYLSFLALPIFAVGCGERGKLEQTLKEKQARQIRYSIAATCDGCNTWSAAYFTPRDIVVAKSPQIEREVYLTVVDDEGVAVTCCETTMRLKVEADGSLALNCKNCGKLVPVDVQDSEVVVVQEE